MQYAGRISYHFLHATMTQPSTPAAARDRRVVLKVRVLMAQRSIRSSAALHRLLASAGVEISNSQLLRIIDNKSTRLNMEVVDALLNIFQCPACDLFGEEPVHAGGHQQRESL